MSTDLIGGSAISIQHFFRTWRRTTLFFALVYWLQVKT